MIDNEKLISLVYERKPLWDTRDKGYHNRDISRKLRDEIANEFGCSCQLVKGRWQNLRDTFRKENSKLTKFTTGDGAAPDKISQWKFYKQLSFLIDVFANRKMESNVPSVFISEDNTEEIQLEETQIQDQEDEDQLSENTHNINQTDNDESLKASETYEKEKSALQRRQTSSKTAISKLLQIEEKKIKHLENLCGNKRVQYNTENDDEDFHFLMSILPYLRDVPKKRKLIVRTKIQHIFIEENEESLLSEIYSNSSRSHSVTTPGSPPSPVFINVCTDTVDEYSNDVRLNQESSQIMQSVNPSTAYVQLINKTVK